MQNLSRRYDASAICQVTVEGTFNDSNVRGWVDKLQVGRVVRSIRVAESAHIDVAGFQLVARLFPFAVDYESADAWVVLRHSVLATGRLPAVELRESGSKYLVGEALELALRVSSQVDRGNDALAKYLGQPFFVAQAWTSTPRVTTEPEEMLLKVRAFL